MTPATVVVDASVALKWLFGIERGERDTPNAIALLHRVATGEVRMLQPAHFVAEVAAVLAREAPARATRSVSHLLRIDMDVVADEATLLRAVELATAHDQHLFDALYHAVALGHEDAVYVTADERYWRAAHPSGRVVRLADFATLH
ncbi:MAG TPA: type II toxin-antitoxin system VapC family toxin [Burkholderiaceae bacterium]|nr:type II toxin-antitoxin system VapC family toxin [Burkholderiaceae bacterium]